MKKILGIIILSLLVSNITFANKNKNTWDYPLLEYTGWVIKGSENHYKFQSNLREDKDVLKEFKNNKKTGIISYLLYSTAANIRLARLRAASSGRIAEVVTSVAH